MGMNQRIDEAGPRNMEQTTTKKTNLNAFRRKKSDLSSFKISGYANNSDWVEWLSSFVFIPFSACSTEFTRFSVGLLEDK